MGGHRATMAERAASRPRRHPKKPVSLLLLLLCSFWGAGCEKLVHVIIVNRYPTEVVYVEEQMPSLRIVAGGTGVLLRSIRDQKKFVFELQGGKRVTHVVSDIEKRKGAGTDAYIIDLDPASKDGAGNDKFPAMH
ncbi:MAG: hypothetical protein IT363_01495 [Methanoregulaceae archaeon]|nr:hypothetical protein [Methanoregulaceae archaeon]